MAKVATPVIGTHPKLVLDVYREAQRLGCDAESILVFDFLNTAAVPNCRIGVVR
jgi:hypothetical protein